MKSLSDIVDHIHKNEATGLTKEQITAASKGVIKALTVALAGGEEIRINGFGTFKTAERAARMGRNPATGEQKQIAASTSVKFKASNTLKAAVA